MKILSLDTSATPVFAAIETDESNQIQTVQTRVLEQSRGLSRDIILAINGALEEAGWNLDDLDAIAVGLGPGSWTGLRVGISTAKTIAQARSLPLFGIPTFDAFVPTAKATNDVSFYAVAPCRAGEIYVKSWQAREGQWVSSKAEQIITLENIAEQLRASSQETLIITLQGQNVAPETIADSQRQVIEISPRDLAQNLALLAAKRLQKGERDDPLALNPLYLAPSSAERVRAERLAREGNK